jgi:hypothetical protein
MPKLYEATGGQPQRPSTTWARARPMRPVQRLGG